MDNQSNRHGEACITEKLNTTISDSSPVLQAENISYSYYQKHHKIPVLHDISLTLSPGERIALVGPSGTGKSTLLHLLGLLDIPQKGDIFLSYNKQWMSTKTLGDYQRTLLRGKNIGFVYQFHYLLNEFTALENVAMPLLIQGIHRRHAFATGRALLEKVHMDHRIHHLPSQLSGGQQQRVAIARALANNPCILLADEPTGNLDHQTTQDILHLFEYLSTTEHLAIVMATHNIHVYDTFHKIFRLHNGSLEKNKNVTSLIKY